MTAPYAPSQLSLSNFDATQAATATWFFSSSDSTVGQQSFEVKIFNNDTGAQVLDTGVINSAQTQYTIPAGTLVNRTVYKWQVQYTDSNGTVSPWSSYQTFTCSSLPTTSITNPTNGQTINGNTLSVSCSYAQAQSQTEQSFRLVIYASDQKTIVADSGTLLSTANAQTFYGLTSGNYFAQSTVTSADGLTNTSSVQPFTLNYSGGASTPNISATPLPAAAAIRVDWTNDRKILGTYVQGPTTQLQNLVQNSDAETVTTTAAVFSDALTSYTGSTVPKPWTLQSGSFTFGATGATSGATGSLMTAGNAQWKPVLGSDGITKLALKVEATFTTTSTPSTTEFGVYLFVDANNQYLVNINGTGSNVFPILKKSGGSYSTLNSVAFTPAASTTYTLTLQIDNTGALTATITPSGGATTTLTATDASPLAGGFLVGVGGDTNVIVSNASVTAPWANGWTIGGDSRVAWALTQNAISGKYSPCANGVEAGVLGQAYQNLNVVAGTQYMISAYLESSNVGSTDGDNVSAYASGTTLGSTTAVKGTTSATRYTATFTPSAGMNNVNINLNVNDSGTVTFDSIQLQLGNRATTYMRNDSTSGSITETTPYYLTGKWSEALQIANYGEKVYWTFQQQTQFTYTSWFLPNVSSSSFTTSQVLAHLRLDGQNLLQMRYDPSDSTFVFEKYANGNGIVAKSAAITFTAGEHIFIVIQQSSTSTVAYVGAGGTFYTINFGTQQDANATYGVGVYGVDTYTADDPGLVTIEYAYVGSTPADGFEANCLFDETHLTLDILTESTLQGYYTNATQQTFTTSTVFLAEFDGNLVGGQTSATLASWNINRIADGVKTLIANIPYDSSLQTATYTDNTPLSGVQYTYEIDSVDTSGNVGNDPTVNCTVTFDGWWLSDPTTGTTFQFYYNVGDVAQKKTYQRTQYDTFGNFPIIAYGPGRYHSGKLTGWVIDTGTGQTAQQQYQALEAMIDSHRQLVLRGDEGQGYVVDVYDPTPTVKARNHKEYQEIEISWTEVAAS